MKSIHLAEASQQDAETIAHIHSYSWKTHYRGMVSDQYLDHLVEQDRLEVWRKRMSTADPKRSVVLAKEAEAVCGFACTFLDCDPAFGALLDNLHVLPGYQGRGLGRALMQYSAGWVYRSRPGQPLYLWVLMQNKDAIRFYERLGGRNVETIRDTVPGGGKALISRYIWSDPALLM